MGGGWFRGRRRAGTGHHHASLRSDTALGRFSTCSTQRARCLVSEARCPTGMRAAWRRCPPLAVCHRADSAGTRRPWNGSRKPPLVRARPTGPAARGARAAFPRRRALVRAPTVLLIAPLGAFASCAHRRSPGDVTALGRPHTHRPCDRHRRRPRARARAVAQAKQLRGRLWPRRRVGPTAVSRAAQGATAGSCAAGASIARFPARDAVIMLVLMPGAR